MSVATDSWEPEVQSHWQPGQRLDWELVEGLGHSALGLRFEQLSKTLAPLHGFDEDDAPLAPDVASQYALGAHGVLSREIGRMASMRASWSAKFRILVAMLMTEVPSQPVPFRAFAESYDQFRWDRKWGWGSGPAGMRRLAEYTVRERLCDADPVLGRQRWRLTSKLDYAPLNQAWARALSLGDVDSGFIALLPVAACSCFAASRRRVALEGMDGEPNIVDVPSLWELIAAALALGPSRLKVIGQRFLTLEAQRLAGTRGENRGRPEMSAKTIETAHGYLNGLLATLATVAKGLVGITSWTETPHLELANGIIEDNPARTEVRTAVPVHVYRLARQRLRAKVEASRGQGHQARADGSEVSRIRFTTNLRRCIFVNLLGEACPRPNDFLRTTVRQVNASHDFAGEFSSPAIFIQSSRKGKRPVEPHWRPISQETYALITEWIDWRGLGPDDQLWPLGDNGNIYTSAELASDFHHAGIITGPDGTVYCPSRVRHMGKQLAFSVGTHWIAAHPGCQERVSAKVFDHGAGGHRMKEDELGYHDLEANRELWAARAAFGDPLLGIAGLVDLLTTDAGARKGWDTAVIRQAVLRLEDERQSLGRAIARLQQAEDERAAAENLLSPCALAAASDRVLNERSIGFDVAKDRVDRMQRELTAAESRVQAAEAALDDIKRRGRSLPLSDDDTESLPGGLSPAELERETWEQALQRTCVRTAQASDMGAGNEPLKLRGELNLQELAGVLSVCDRTVRQWCEDPNSPLASEGAIDCLVTVSKRMRCVVAARLPLPLLGRLLPEQHELIAQMLMVPMGSTRWKGPAIPSERIEAADRHPIR